ncbi:MAG TPA: sigma-54 dependent transcriptional regulator [Verrucomicrobiae bacterium]|nr:sigma-54 dependent transcriptional regulator [Verrucomicrobiae bacterium]
MARILVVDDDDLMCSTLSHVCGRHGHEPSCVHTLGAAVQRAAREPFDLVFLDVRMPDGNGLDTIAALREAPSQPEVVIMTGYGDPRGAELAITGGAWDYIEKGASTKEITLALVRALEYRRQKMRAAPQRSVVALKRDQIIGNSQRMRDCLDLVALAASSDAAVLVTGETGCGKELFARAVHANSARHAGPFVTVDCAALPDSLVESLLFGHEKGSFTGAEHAREGLVRQSAGGTLFLDEVGELPLAAQKSFLRVLQERRFRPVGSSREVECDFRVVAATNRDLEKMAAEGAFRGDLLFRLRSFLIELPPLREHPADIRALARHHTDRLCERYRHDPKGFSPDFIRAITSYAWPGNVRELVNALDRAVAAAGPEPILFSRHLPTEIRVSVARSMVGNGNGREKAEAAEAPRVIPKLQDYRDSIWEEAERRYLHDLMASAGNDIAEACRISGLSTSRLYALLKTREVPRPH